jgi:hypothetical protein
MKAQRKVTNWQVQIIKRVTADNGKTIEQLRRQFDMREIGTTSHWGVEIPFA